MIHFAPGFFVFGVYDGGRCFFLVHEGCGEGLGWVLMCTVGRGVGAGGTLF